PAPPGAKGVRPYNWGVSFDQSLSEEEFERELRRILKQYGVRLVDPAEYTPPLQTKIPELRYALLKVSKARARQIARRRAVIEVNQEYEIPVTVFSGTPTAKKEMQ